MEHISTALARAPLFALPKVARKSAGPANDQKTLEHPRPEEFIAPAADVLWREGAEYAQAWLSRAQTGSNGPGQLETLLNFLGGGVMFSAACRTIERAVGGGR